MDYSTLFGNDNIGDLVLDGFGIFQKAISGFFDGDFFSGDGTYPAVVISNPVNIAPSEYTALGFPNYDANSSRAYKKFKVRIINKRHNPHAMLENPCDLSTAQERCQQNALVASHTTVATNRMMGVGIGALVKIKLDKSPNDTYNLQTAHLLEVLQPNDTGAEILSKEACDSMVTMFEYGEAYEPPPEVIINSDLFEWADKYDAEPVPNKRQHAPFLRAIEAKGYGFHYYVKTFFYLVWKRRGYSITINSGVRSQQEQTRLYNAYIARGSKGLPAIKTVGYHGGLAIDMNFNTEGVSIGIATAGDGVAEFEGTIGSAGLMKQSAEENKDLWITSGIVDIAKEVGLKWGGEFSGYYDPIHFQWLPGGWTAKDVEMHATNPAKPPTSTAAGTGAVGRKETNADHDLQVMGEDYEAFPAELRGAASLGSDLLNDDPREADPWEGDANQNGILDTEEGDLSDEEFWSYHPDYNKE